MLKLRLLIFVNTVTTLKYSIINNLRKIYIAGAKIQFITHASVYAKQSQLD